MAYVEEKEIELEKEEPQIVEKESEEMTILEEFLSPSPIKEITFAKILLVSESNENILESVTSSQLE